VCRVVSSECIAVELDVSELRVAEVGAWGFASASRAVLRSKPFPQWSTQRRKSIVNLGRLPKATILCVVAVALNVVATQLEVTGPWILVVFLLALIGTLIAETEPAQHMETARVPESQSEDFLHLTVWALLTAMIGAVIAGVFLVFPPGDWQFQFWVGGVFGYQRQRGIPMRSLRRPCSLPSEFCLPLADCWCLGYSRQRVRLS
jgi:hypothetical protein